MGTKGAAIATVIGQFMGLLAGILINRRWNREITFAFTLRPDWSSVRTILRVGVPSTLVQVLTSFVSIVMNTILLAFSSTAVAVFGVCNRMQGLCTVGVHGVDNGLIPIVAYNYGAWKPERIRQAFRWALVDSLLFFIPFLLLLEIAPGWVMQLFNASGVMMGIGAPAVRWMALAWLISIPNLVVASSLQGLSLARPSMVLTMLRQAVLPVLLALGLTLLGSLDWVWSAFVIAEALCIPLAIRMWSRNMQAVFAPQGKPEHGQG